MTDTVGQPVVVSPSPRHMRKRRFMGEIAASQLPGNHQIAKTIPEARPDNAAADPGSAQVDASPAMSKAKPIAKRSPFKKASLRQKRLVALAAVILVSVSIPLLVLTLMFAG
ncbi:hypothetical protein AAHB33_15315 [Paenarthrobacter sp. S56]|uniref:hypothetical protein n=1 Tax=Paenarthrobacter sp. S56 TaxID=3138179 RepID=UPI0032197DDB